MLSFLPPLPRLGNDIGIDSLLSRIALLKSVSLFHQKNIKSEERNKKTKERNEDTEVPYFLFKDSKRAAKLILSLNKR